MKIKKTTLKKIIAEEYARKRVRDLLQETFMDRVKIHTGEFMGSLGRGASNIYNFLTMQTPVKVDLRYYDLQADRNAAHPRLELNIDIRDLPILAKTSVGEYSTETQKKYANVSISALLEVSGKVPVIKLTKRKLVLLEDKLGGSIPKHDYVIHKEKEKNAAHKDQEISATFSPRDIALGFDKPSKARQHVGIPAGVDAVGKKYGKKYLSDKTGEVQKLFFGTSRPETEDRGSNPIYFVPENKRDDGPILNFSDEAIKECVEGILNFLNYYEHGDQKKNKIRPLLGEDGKGGDRYAHDFRLNFDIFNRVEKYGKS